MRSSAEELDGLLREANIPVLLGLRQQGHIPTVRRMLADGKSWAEIGEAIGWQAEAAERWYRIEMAPAMWAANEHGLTLDVQKLLAEAKRRYPEEGQ